MPRRLTRADAVVRRVSVPELIGRRAELAVLDAALSDADAGTGRLVLVEGDAGVGKTRLVQEFADRARRGGAAVLAGGCLQLEADIPYAPFDEALDALPDKPVFGSGFADRAGQFRRVADAIAGAGRPVVLVLEDLHWADASTRDLFVYLQRALRQAPVLQIGTHRSGEVGGDHPVAGMVAELARLPHTERIRLAPLDPAETAELARGLVGVPPAREMIKVLLARAEGNPFFTEELIAAWPARGEVPQTVREVVLTRLARLTEGARQLSRLASVIGRTVSHDLLAALAGLSEVDIGVSVRDLIHHGQLVPAGEDGYAFRHALIREAIYADLLPGERRHAHSRVARLLTDRAAAAELAHPHPPPLPSSLRPARWTRRSPRPCGPGSPRRRRSRQRKHTRTTSGRCGAGRRRRSRSCWPGWTSTRCWNARRRPRAWRAATLGRSN